MIDCEEMLRQIQKDLTNDAFLTQFAIERKALFLVSTLSTSKRLPDDHKELLETAAALSSCAYYLKELDALAAGIDALTVPIP